MCNLVVHIDMSRYFARLHTLSFVSVWSIYMHTHGFGDKSTVNESHHGYNTRSLNLSESSLSTLISWALGEQVQAWKRGKKCVCVSVYILFGIHLTLTESTL